MTRSSVKWTMYLISLHGQGTSSCPSASGIPTECSAGTKSAFVSSMRASASAPMRVMIFIEMAT